MMDFFDDKYVALSETAVAAATAVVTATRIGAGRVFQYRDFDNMMPPNFDGVQHPIIAIRWMYVVEGCFFTCSFLADPKVRCALNLLGSGAKD